MAADNTLFETFNALLHQQVFIKEKLDYTVLDKHIPLLRTIAQMGNSAVSVYDLCQEEHVYYSSNFGTLLGYNAEEATQKGKEYWDSKIHPEDYIALTLSSMSVLKLFNQFSAVEKANHKFISEYRFMNASGEYVRVIEQHQSLELDDHGNNWLSLSILDISHNQNETDGFLSQLINFKTGKIIPFQEPGKQVISISLTAREKQVLKMVRDGLLSKEISDQLFISINTVNTHRQRVLEKLGANNSMEAVILATKLGLL